MNSSQRSYVGRLDELQVERREYLNQCGDDFGATCIGGRVEIGNEYRGYSDQVAFVAMSISAAAQDNAQGGGYGIVWLDKERDNEFGMYNGPKTGSLIFLLKAIQDVLRKSDLNKPLIIASNNKLICDYLNGETRSVGKENNHLRSDFKIIEEYIARRTAPTSSYWVDGLHTGAERVQRFYDMAKEVASLSLKLWLYREGGSREDSVGIASPASDRRSPSLPPRRDEQPQRSEVRPSRSPSVSNKHGAGPLQRKLSYIDRKRVDLLQKYRKTIATATDRGEEKVAVIGMSVERPDISNKQLGAFGIVWLNRDTSIQAASHYGPDTKSMIFLLQAVYDAMVTCPSNKPLLIALKHASTVNFINNVHPSISNKNRSLAQDVEKIENLLKMRDAQTRAILITHSDAWMNDFYNLAMNAASEARRTALKTGTSDSQYPQPRAPSPLLSNSQDYQPQNETHEPVPIQTDLALRELEVERKRVLQQFRTEVGQDPNKLEQKIVLLAMSVDAPRPDGNQLGGYGAVWFHEDFPNQVGYYDGPVNASSIHILLAMRDALAASRPDEPLLIGLKHAAVYNYMSGQQTEISHEAMLEPYILEINQLIEKRTSSVELFLIKGSKDKPWHEMLYNIAKNVASEGRKQRKKELVLDQGTTSTAQPSSHHQQASTSSSSFSTRQPDVPNKHNVSFDKLDTIVTNFKEFQAERGELLKVLQRLRELGELKDATWYEPQNQIATIAMSADPPRQNGRQVGGYGVTWLNEEPSIQLGSHDAEDPGATLFLLMALKDAISVSHPDRPLHIYTKHSSIFRYFRHVISDHALPPRLQLYLQDINRMLRSRTSPLTVHMIDSKSPCVDLFYELARKVASEARKIRVAEGIRDRADLSSSPPPAFVPPPTGHPPTSTPPNLENGRRVDGIHPARAAMLGFPVEASLTEEKEEQPAKEKQEEEQHATKKRSINDAVDNDSVMDESLDSNKRRKTSAEDENVEDDVTGKNSLRQALDFGEWHAAVRNFKEWIDGMLWR